MAELENCNRKRAYLYNDFFWPLYRLSFTWNCGCLALKKGTNLLFKEQKVNSEIGSGFPPPPPKKKKSYVFGEWNSVKIVQITDPKRGIVGKIYIC